jgi:thiol-disulfide isomerase/thioredoxin
MSVTRRLFILTTITLLIAPGAADASERIKYEAATFQAAQQAGRPILVHVTAPWCGECKLQKPIVARLSELPEYKDLLIVDVDFDTQKDVLRSFKVRKQSTLIAFRGSKETARSVGVTDQEKINALMKKAL